MTWKADAGKERSTELAPFWRPDDVGAGVLGEVQGHGTYKVKGEVVPCVYLGNTVVRRSNGTLTRGGDVTISLNRALLAALPRSSTPAGTLVQIMFTGIDAALNGMHRYEVREVEPPYLLSVYEDAAAQDRAAGVA